VPIFLEIMALSASEHIPLFLWVPLGPWRFCLRCHALRIWRTCCWGCTPRVPTAPCRVSSLELLVHVVEPRGAAAGHCGGTGNEAGHWRGSSEQARHARMLF